MFVIALTLSLTPAHAGPGDGRLRNTAQRADNQADQQDDRRDAAVIVELVDSWKRAIAAGDSGAALQTDARIFAWLEEEIAESSRDLAEARRETAASRRETRGSRRQAASQGGAVNRVETRDDRRDTTDDRVDTAQAAQDLEQTKAVQARLTALQPAFRDGRATPAQVQEKRGLLESLVAMSRRELLEGQEEIREDRVETREDRRVRRR